MYLSDNKSILSTAELYQAGSSGLLKDTHHPQQQASLLSSCLTSWPWPTLPPLTPFLRFHGASLPLLLPWPFLLPLPCWFLHLLPVCTLEHSLGLPSVCCPWISWFSSCPNISYVQIILIFVFSSDFTRDGCFHIRWAPESNHTQAELRTSIGRWLRIALGCGFLHL